MDLHGFSLIFFFFLSFLLFFCHFFISQILDLSVWDGRITQIFYERFLPLKLLRTKADSQFLQRDSVAV